MSRDCWVGKQGRRIKWLATDPCPYPIHRQCYLVAETGITRNSLARRIKELSKQLETKSHDFSALLIGDSYVVHL